MPDEELLALAERGELADARVISSQVKRMLADPRAAALVTNFAQQWLDIRGVRDIVPDPVLFPEYNPDLGDAFARELELFLASVLLEDRSVLELLNGKHTFLNERLALHYGVPAVRGDNFRRVELADENRWGLFGKGGILMATSYPNRTAPVLRGAWILEAITGTPPASPPPDVEAFPETQEGEQPRTVRERLEHASRQSDVQRLPWRHGSARLRARELRRDWRLAREGSRSACGDRLVGPARRRHRRRRARRLA